MEVSVTDAKAHLTDLVRRAEAGEEVVLTRHGKPAVQLKVIEKRREWTAEEREKRYQLLLEISEKASKKALPGPDAAHSADFLYDDDGMPA
ncbi:MAG: type II toxin-antitoxin system prevent-host-death family antitoxin [Devosia sp.]